MTVDTRRSSPRLSSIRIQIIIGFGLILGLTLVIVFINFVGFQNLQTNIESTVDEVSRVRELGQKVQNEFLLARQQERLFLDGWRSLGVDIAISRHATADQTHITQARQDVEELNNLITTGESEGVKHLADEVTELGPLLLEYEGAFLSTVVRIQERSEAGGLELELQKTLNLFEDSVISLIGRNELVRSAALMRANEQAFFNTGEQQYIDQTRLLAIQSKELANTSPHLVWAYSDLTRPRVLEQIDSHMSTFDDLVLLENEIILNVATFQDITGEISELTAHIDEDSAKALDTARTDLRNTVTRSTTLAIVVGLAALGIGIITAILLARRIIGPLNQLTVAAREIGLGKLDHRVSITREDEFGTLARVFNQMTGQLRSLVGSLEQLVADRTRDLTTSFQVSRRLSTILDQDQLVSEVVEQVRSAFDYYHVHIYLYDKDDQHLIMVGGTGEAGQQMLADGHTLDRGQGLVGQVAEKHQPVIVPDVTMNPNWLPNPLLPATQSEVAVPIMIGDRVVGVLDVQHDRRGGLARSDAELLQSIANQVGIALQNAQLYEKAQGSADREALLNVINQKIQKAASVEEVLEVAARELGQALGKRRAIVQLSLPNETTNGRRPLRQQQSAGRGSPNGQPSERNSLEHRGGR